MRGYQSKSRGATLKRSAEGLRRQSEASAAVGTLWGRSEQLPPPPRSGARPPAAASSEELGLSLSHKCTQGEFRLTIASGGNGGSLVRLGASRGRPGCNQRGQVRGF